MRSNTNELRKRLKTILKDVCTTYYQEGAAVRKYPYIVFDLSEINTSAGKTLYKVEVNCISQNNTEAEQLSDLIQDIFDEYSYLDDKMAFYTYKGTRNTVYEENKSIKRRRLLFELHYYSREDE